MEFLDEKLSAYIESHTQPESDLLQRLNRETWAKVLLPRMLSGHLQGRVLAMFSKMIRPSFVLEIGTYTGYSALCLAEGLAPGGKLVTIDINEELSDMVNRYIAEAGKSDQINAMTGNAMDIIPGLADPIDLVFIDADKENYSNYLDLVFPKLRQGGFIIADNVLWSGNVLKPKQEMDAETSALWEFNEKVMAHPGLENVLFPVRDGLMVMRKK
jgi:predicted O-methyltransferase YrrM